VSRIIILPLLVALLSGGCSNNDFLASGPSEGSSLERTSIPVTRIGSGDLPLTFFSGVTDSTRVVIRTEVDWAAIWETIWNPQTPMPALPQVDFTREMVVVAGLGTRSSGGYSIRVDSVFQRAGQIEVVVQKTAPGAACVVTGALTQPVDAVRIPRSADPAVFTVRSTVRAC
jgi:hypothetical protein